MEATAGKKIFRINVDVERERDYSIRKKDYSILRTANLFRRVGKDKMIINRINHLIDGVDGKITRIYEPIPRASYKTILNDSPRLIQGRIEFHEFASTTDRFSKCSKIFVFATYSVI